jgi:hypothetical protein
MLQLFQSIFGSRERAGSSHPDELTERAIERAIDATDPRLRALSGYKKKLRPAATYAIDHVLALVDSLAPALELDPQVCGTDPETTAYFVSVEHMREVLERDPTLNQWRRSEGTAADAVVTLMLMTLEERKGLGMALEGDVVRKDVAQTTVSLSKHQFVDPDAADTETRRLLKRRAFDHLLALALGRMAQAGSERKELEQERDLLRRKKAALASGRWTFDASGGGETVDPTTLQRQLEGIESQLAAGGGSGLLPTRLEILTDVLAQADRNLWSAPHALIVDRMGVKQAQASELAPEVQLTVLHNAAGQKLVARLVHIDRATLPEPRDLLREAERYLG